MSDHQYCNFCRHLIDAATAFPDSLAVAVQKKRFNKLTYQEIDFSTLNKRSDRIAHALNQFGLKSGDKAVLMVKPSVDFFALTFALFKAGIVPILIDPGMGIKNLKQCIAEVHPDAFIGIPKAHIARRLFGWGKDAIKYNITVGGASFWGGTSLTQIIDHCSAQTPYPMVKLTPDQMAAILFTSGSTGSPKGVVYTHRMFEAQITVLRNDYGITHGERDLATFPLFSLFGPALGMASIIPAMDASKPITANPDYIFAAINKYHCTNLFANPALIELLGRAGKSRAMKLQSLQRVISAGAPATLSSIERFTTLLNPGVEILTSYGATEALPVSKIGSVALLKTTDITDAGGGICVGYPVDGMTVSIINITEKTITTWQDDLRLPAYEIGEIVVQGPQVSQCYYQRKNATLAAKIEDIKRPHHRMGDLGYLDSDGQLWMCGRKAHRVDANHLKIKKSYYSIPCERIFNTHPAIKRSALVAVKIDGKTTPLLCIELYNKSAQTAETLFAELHKIADKHNQTVGITLFLIHKKFPMDIRHNAKIYREKLAIWAEKQLID
ncbi:peptide synthase, AMP-dependent synthetase and ligase [Psychromonas ingrahamii 37]|uniref:Peptide synthase, AMP-dependent synthetase and ligase n=1 Tax=Psychromonas ingrahamii (strain DSM 17664 / CCUG 51855 / 37) TaxID=357804 RepID=A1SW99_PSYIN|nr:fatty acid CoA ligase family protein [Psychromonas ingrahamii]ABM03764.1 peptide synthase, AMP-dependent synthetase and ligase [Psychromonas ingrahamii 37]